MSNPKGQTASYDLAMSALRPWHMAVLLICLLAIAAIVAVIAAVAVKRRQ